MFLNIAGFGERITAIHHDGSIVTRVNNCSDNPLGIFQFAASEHHVFLVDVLVYGQGVEAEGGLALEFGYLCGGVYAGYFSLELVEIGEGLCGVVDLLEGG